jgi:S-layer protein (TIGR01567 family)
MEDIYWIAGKYMLLGLFVSILVGCTCATALEFSGDVVELTGAQNEDIVWNESNFGGFCYDLGDGVCAGVETLLITAGTLEGPDVDRTIDEGNLIYTTRPIWREYKLHKNLGLTADSGYYGGDSGYWIEFWMGEMYIAIEGNVDKLVKPLVEFNSADIKTLASGEKWDLGGGFELEAKQIDLEGKKVWLCLYKDGKEFDNEVVDTDNPNLQDRVYTYTEDLAGEYDVPIFSCYVSAVFRGTCSDLVQIRYVFLIDYDVTKIDCGDVYGSMEVMTASSIEVVLRNDETTIDLNPGTTTPIIGNLSFKTKDNTGAIELYLHLLRDEPPVLSGGGGFVPDDCWVGSAWDLSEGYSIAAKDVSLDGAKARIVLLKNGVVVDEIVLTEESVATVDLDCRYGYVKNGTEIINATLKAAFHGIASNAVELGEVYQHSEDGGSVLTNNESHLFKSANPTGTLWALADGYVLTMKDVGFNCEVWLELSKNGVITKETILAEGSELIYTSGAGSIDCVVDRVFCGCKANAVKLVDLDQYSDTDGTALLTNEFHFYRTADPDGMQWELLDGYLLTMKDIEEVNWRCDVGDRVWLELSRDGSVLKDDILEPGDLFTYETGIEIVNCTVDCVFCGSCANVVKLRGMNQYSETGRQLIDCGSKTFATENPTGEIWELYEGYSLDAKDIDLMGETVWLSLSKDGVVMKDAIINSQWWDVDNSWFEYYNSTGALVFSAYVDAVFRGTEDNVVQLMCATQYSEIDGSVLIEFGESEKKRLTAGTATTILPLIVAPIDGQIFVEGDMITFSATASDGAPPYSHRWYENNDVIGTGNSFETSFGTGSHTITLIVTDAAGASVSERVQVEVGIRLRGDVNGDGAITSADAVIVSGMAVRGEWDSAADVNSDSRVTSLDVLMILQAAADAVDS